MVGIEETCAHDRDPAGKNRRQCHAMNDHSEGRWRLNCSVQGMRRREGVNASGIMRSRRRLPTSFWRLVFLGVLSAGVLISGGEEKAESEDPNTCRGCLPRHSRRHAMPSADVGVHTISRRYAGWGERVCGRRRRRRGDGLEAHEGIWLSACSRGMHMRRPGLTSRAVLPGGL
eukprot:2545153-Rhodomonas_salina.3